MKKFFLFTFLLGGSTSFIQSKASNEGSHIPAQSTLSDSSAPSTVGAPNPSDGPKPIINNVLLDAKNNEERIENEEKNTEKKISSLVAKKDTNKNKKKKKGKIAKRIKRKIKQKLKKKNKKIRRKGKINNLKN